MNKLLELSLFVCLSISLIESSGTSYRSIYIKTGEKYLSVSQFRICLQAKEVLMLNVNASHDAVIALMSNLQSDKLMYEVVIDSTEDNATVIRRRTGKEMYVVAKKNNTTFLQNEKFLNLIIKRETNELKIIQRTMSNENQMINSTYGNMPSSVYISVSTRFGATGLWKYEFRGNDKPETVQGITMCPLDPKCGFEKNVVREKTIAKCKSRLKGVSLQCQKKKGTTDAIYLQYKCTAPSDGECGKEILVITGCQSEEENHCRECKVKQIFKRDITEDCPGYMLLLINNTSCDFHKKWNKYLTAVLFTHAPNDSTDLPSPISTSSENQTTSYITTVSVSPNMSYANQSMENGHFASSNKLTEIGLSAGLAGMVLILVVLSCILLVLKRRHEDGNMKIPSIDSSKIKDYTGNQNIAMPGIGNSTNCLQSTSNEETHVYYEIKSLPHENGAPYDYIDLQDTKFESQFIKNVNKTAKVSFENSQQKCEIVNKFETDQNDRLIPITTEYKEEINDTCMSIAPMIPKCNSVDTDSKRGEIDSTYFALDPEETGFSRFQTSPVLLDVPDPNKTEHNQSTNVQEIIGVYELAKPADEVDDHCKSSNGLQFNGISAGEPLNGDNKVDNMQLKLDKGNNTFNYSTDDAYDPNESSYDLVKNGQKITSDYELAKPTEILDDNYQKSANSIFTNDMSDKEFINADYDAVSMQSKLDKGDNIYNRTTDNLYDSAFHKQQICRQENDYDHFRE